MNQTPIAPEDTDSVLVCGECGRVNQIPTAFGRSTAVRCSGCGNLLRGERPRKISLDCPECHKSLEIEPSWLGHQIICGGCAAQFVARRDDYTLPGKSGGTVPADIAKRVGQPESSISELLDAETVGEVDANGMLKKVRRTRKKKRVRDKSRIPVIKFVFSTLLTFAVVIGIIVWVGKRANWWLSDPVAETAPVAPKVAKKAVPTGPLVATDEIPALDNTIHLFQNAGSADEFLACVRYPTEVAPRLRLFYANQQFKTVGGFVVHETARLAVGDSVFLRMESEPSDGTPRVLVVERHAPGKFLVDWDSFVRYHSIPWDTFVARRGAEPQRFQAFIKRDFLGNAYYPLEEYTGYLVYWNDESDGVPLFVKTDSDEDRRLAAATEPQKMISPIEPSSPPLGSYPVTLEVFFAPATNGERKPPALELKTFVHDGWINVASGAN